MPLIDVVFLLVTFFIYSMTLMIRAQVLPVELPGLSEGRAAPNVDAISITLDESGALFVDAQPTPLDEIIARVLAARDAKPEARIYVAAALEGDQDRLPIFIELVNRLRGSGVDEFFIVGRPPDDAAPTPGADP